MKMIRLFAWLAAGAALALAACDNSSSQPPSPPSPTGIALEGFASDPHVFPPADLGYGEQAPLTVTVRNTGDTETGALTATLSSDGAASFTLTGGALASIAANAAATFTVRPNTGLDPGTHAAVVTVAGAGIELPRSFGVTFTVNAAGTETRGIGLSPSEPHVFEPLTEGFEAAERTPLTVTVSNLDDRPSGALTAVMAGADASAFALTGGYMESIPVGDSTRTFSVIPNLDLEAGTYEAFVMVAGMQLAEPRTLAVSFTVNPRAHSIELSQRAAHVFDPLNIGYTSAGSLTVTVTNTGIVPTGNLVAAVLGDDSGSFTVSAVTPADIPAGGTGTFTVSPALGLGERLHEARVTVSGIAGNDIPARHFDVSVDVRRPITHYFVDQLFLTVVRGNLGIHNRDIYASDVRNVTSLRVLGFGAHVEGSISTAAGIEFFVNLESLSLTNHGFLHLIDLSHNTQLRELDLSGSRLVSLDVSALVNLEILDASDNIIEDPVSFVNNPVLWKVMLQNNFIPSIDVTGSGIGSPAPASTTGVFVDFRNNSMTGLGDVIGWGAQTPPMVPGTDNFMFEPQRP